MDTQAQITENYRTVCERVQAACQRSGRNGKDVTLVAVTKYARPEWVQALIEAGVVDLGESRPQQLVARAEQFDGGVRWHLIGSLQRNKARRTLPLVAMIHSVDSFRLLDTLQRLAGEMDLQPRVLLQVNVSGESAKHGFDPEELAANFSEVAACTRLRVDGLMTMAPLTPPEQEEIEQTRPVFCRLRKLRDRLREEHPQFPLAELSMGMSRDFEVAVEEGATIIRIGSLLFEGLEGDD